VGDTRLGFVVVHVRDVAASARFYDEAFGFEPSTQDVLSVRLAPLPAKHQAASSVELGFVVDDLGAAHARAVGAGASVVREPREDPSGRTAAYLDPDGNLVTLTQRPRALRVAGVDLARGGLAVVVLENDRVVEAFRCETFADALLVDAEVVAVDVPIGIPDAGPRAADVAARHFVGARSSSVFATPIRRALEAATYAEARGIAIELTGKSLSAQSYALGRRILEVDEYAERDERVIEVHPEVSFRELARRPLLSKHRADGLAERRALLEQAGLEVPASAPRIAEPDLLDATIAAWSARRYAVGEAVPLPQGHGARIGAIWR
jgi:predicted RNase H-like nuclease/predicted enzyme related to lactoylglutathione lyase